ARGRSRLMHERLIEAMQAQRAFAATLQRIPPPSDRLRIDNLPGSAASPLGAALSAPPEQRARTAVARAPADAEAVEADLRSLLEADHVALFPQRETLPYEAAEHHVEVSGLRVETLEALLSGRARIVVTTARALQELADMPAGLADLRLTLAVGDTFRLSDLTDRLDEMGFDRAAMVEAVGEYSVRGGIVDLF